VTPAKTLAAMPAPQPKAQPDSVNPQGVAQVEAERQRRGITPEELEKRRRDSITRPF
jgi:hypothetical protein